MPVTQTQPSSSPTEEKSQLVQMRLQPKTLQRIQNLVSITGTENRTQLISSSIQLTEEILTMLKGGGKVYFENKNGEKEVLKFIGF